MHSSTASHSSHHDDVNFKTKDLNLAAFLSYHGITPSHVEPAPPNDPQRHAAFVFPRTPALAEAFLEFSSSRTTFVELRRYNTCRGELLRQASSAKASSANRDGGR